MGDAPPAACFAARAARCSARSAAASRNARSCIDVDRDPGDAAALAREVERCFCDDDGGGGAGAEGGGGASVLHAVRTRAAALLEGAAGGAFAFAAHLYWRSYSCGVGAVVGGFAVGFECSPVVWT